MPHPSFLDDACTEGLLHLAEPIPRTMLAHMEHALLPEERHTRKYRGYPLLSGMPASTHQLLRVTWRPVTRTSWPYP